MLIHITVCVECSKFQCCTWSLNGNVMSAGNSQCWPVSSLLVSPSGWHVIRLLKLPSSPAILMQMMSSPSSALSFSAAWLSAAPPVSSHLSHTVTSSSFNSCLFEFYSLSYFLVRWNIMVVLMIQQSFVYLPA